MKLKKNWTVPSHLPPPPGFVNEKFCYSYSFVYEEIQNASFVGN